jgi:uncharacterized protein (UPF0333 family)
MNIKNKRGQSTVEYILLVTAVVAVVIGFVATQNKGGFQDQLNQTINGASQEMTNMTDRLASGEAIASPSNSATSGTPVGYNVTVG